MLSTDFFLAFLRPRFNRFVLAGLVLIFLGILLSPVLIGLPILALGGALFLWGGLWELKEKGVKLFKIAQFFGFTQLPPQVQQKIFHYFLLFLLFLSLIFATWFVFKIQVLTR